MSHLSYAHHVSATSRARSAAIRAGALAAAGTLAIVVLPALVGWLAAPEGTLGWFSAVQVGAAIWFVGHGQSIGGGGVSISLTPLVLFLLFGYVAVRWCRRLIAIERAVASRSEWNRVAQRGIVPGFLVGYVGAGAVFSLLTLGAPVAPGVAAVPGTAVVPLAALGYLLLRPADADAPGFVRAWFLRGPSWLPFAWRVGWRGAGMLLLVGLGVVVLRLLVSAPEVLRIQGDYGLNLAAGVVVVLAQAMLLGNATTWALAFLAGPGFSIATDSMISPASAEPGLMPMVPILGALPSQADYPAALFAVVLLPVACGIAIGRWLDREVEFFGNVRARLIATSAAAVIAVTVIGLLTWLANGSVGVERLAAVGPAVAPMVGALLVEVLVGALAWAGWSLWRDRAASPEESAAGVPEPDDSAQPGPGGSAQGPEQARPDASPQGEPEPVDEQARGVSP
ncbi:DUF6350 family protein [Intrasporangium sp. DVR]|uniref:cell division protein PerM n=1 Tax=Intrasporangium sp. DVR TaxID=3127867 RepID=UPI00313A6DDD